MAYHAQPGTSKDLLYGLAWKGLEYALVVLAILQVSRCLFAVASTAGWTGQGEVLLIPCEIIHSRFLSKKQSIGSSYLVVGIPVGWEGSCGGLVSSAPKISSWLSFSKACWYNVDPADHLDPKYGEAKVGLRGKLNMYLESQVRAMFSASLPRDTDEKLQRARIL